MVDPAGRVGSEALSRTEVDQPVVHLPGPGGDPGVDERPLRTGHVGHVGAGIVVGRILPLAAQRGEDPPVGADRGSIRRGQVLLDLLVEGRQRVVGHRREDVMLDVVVHVGVQEPQERVQVHRAGVVAMVEHVLSQARVLHGPEEHHEPGPVEGGQPDVQRGHDGTDGHAPRRGAGQHCDVGPRLPLELGQLVGRNEVTGVVVDTARGVLESAPHRLGQQRHRQVHTQHGAQRARPGKHDLGVAPHDDGVGVVADVRPAPQGGLAQQHERRDVVDGVVEPLGPERGAVAALVPARVARAAVERAVGHEGGHRPPSAESAEGQVAEDGQQAEPHDRVAGRPGVVADLQGPQPLTVDGWTEPLRLDKTPLDGKRRVPPGKGVVPHDRGHGLLPESGGH